VGQSYTKSEYYFKQHWAEEVKILLSDKITLVMAKAPLGSGARFAELKGKLAKKGATNPGALAAWIGRKKYGKKKFQALGARARAKKH
jgi:hypothetical protein